MKKLNIALALAVGLSVATPAAAAPRFVTTPVFRLAQDATSAWIYGSSGGFSPVLISQCPYHTLFAFDPRTDEGKRYIALLTAAFLSGRSVVIYYDDGVGQAGGGTSCYASSMGSYTKPTRIDITQ